MRWKSDEPLTREEVEKKVGTIGGFTIPTWRQRGGLVWILLIVVLVALVLSGGLPGDGSGVNYREVLRPFPEVPRSNKAPAGGPIEFARDIQQTWKQLFARADLEFRPATIVARSATSDCASRAKGDAFYCYSDSKLLLFRQLANPYLVAHAYAHHVQELLDITEHVAGAVKSSPRQGGDLWRRHELQADCVAGVSLRSMYHPDEAAAMVDRAMLPTAPDQFLDSESWNGAPRAQRSAWFMKGLRAGKASVCDTFSTNA